MAESPLQLVSRIGAQLAGVTRFNKSLFLKSLKQAASALAEIEQPVSPEASKKQEALERLGSATEPLRKSIIKHGLIQPKDKDVRLFVTICVSEIFRILAPELPFEDKYLRGVFELIVHMFKELGDTTCPFFSRRVKILETVARCKCFVIMLDIECNDLVLEMFNNFFSVLSEHHQPNLINDMLSIMTHILSDEASQPLLEVILQNLVKQGKDVPSAASQLAVSVIQSCAEQLEPFVCGFLTSCFSDRDAVGSELKEFYHEIMFKIFQCAPQMLRAIIPNLIQELWIDQVDVRIKAVNLVGKLFALPENSVAERYRELFVEFLKRFSDKSAEVRVCALRCAKACYLANPFGTESHEILSVLESRLLDIDDRVRTEAVIIACDLARSNLKFIPPKLLSEATERLRDKKIAVRKKALQKLLEAYRDYCKKCYEGRMTICDHFEWIPCKVLMLCYDKDCNEFRSQNIDRILVEDLFPVLEIEERTKHWVHLYSLFTPLHVKALNSILYQKQRLRTQMQFYLSLRKKEKENCLEETQKRIRSLFMKMSTSFLDPSRAVECFQRLNKLKDNNVFNALDELLDALTIKDAKTARDKLLKLIGDKHPDFEFLQLVSSKCLYIFDSEHVRCIVDGLSSNRFGDKQFEVSSVKLLLAIINFFPSLLRGSELQFQKLLEGSDPINVKLIEVLAKAGPHISVKFSDFYPLLERLCLEGTRDQSKPAVSAIASLSGSSEQFVFAELCKQLVDSLLSGQNIPTVLQSLGCIAQYSVSTFETHDEDITPYIYKNILQVKLSDDSTSSDGTSGCGASSNLKIYGLKTLVKSFLPHHGSCVKRKINELLEILSQMLQSADTFDDLLSSEGDNAHIRIAAAKSVLRLSRKWDLHISPEIFSSTVLMAKNSSTFVRRSFLDKAHKWLKARVIPCRYACAFALAASDCMKDLQDASLKYMAEFIKEYSREARIRQNYALQEVSITDYPAYVVVFLIHVLAHDTGFPPEDCQDEGMIAQFFCPFFSFLQALVNASIVDGDMDLVKDAILYLICIFRAIKRAEDAIDAQRTPNLHVLADIGISIITVLNHNGLPSSRAPGSILLPSSFYRISLSKKSKEVNSESPSQFSFERSFVERVVRIFKSHISLPARTLSKRSQRRQQDSTQSDVITHSKLNLEVCNQFDLPTCGAMDPKNKNVRQETDTRCKQKGAHFSSASVIVGMPNKSFTVEECKNGASKSSASIPRKELLSSCDSVAMDSVPESQVSSQTIERSAASLKENVITDDSRKSELLCSDNERWDTSGDSLSEREVLMEEDSNTFHLQHSHGVSNPSHCNLNKSDGKFGDDAAQEQKNLSKQERGKFSSRAVLLTGKGKRGRQTSNDMSASEVSDVNVNAVVKRSRRQKV